LEKRKGRCRKTPSYYLKKERSTRKSYLLERSDAPSKGECGNLLGNLDDLYPSFRKKSRTIQARTSFFAENDKVKRWLRTMPLAPKKKTIEKKDGRVKQSPLTKGRGEKVRGAMKTRSSHFLQKEEKKFRFEMRGLI